MSCSKRYSWRPAAGILCSVVLAAAFFVMRAQPASPPVLAAMQAELARTREKLKSQPVPPYYISYEIVETHSVAVAGEFGKIEGSSENRNRYLDIDLRIGDYNLDNTHEIRGEMNVMQYHSSAIPIDNDPDAIRAALWYETDASYKRALDQLTKIRTNVQVKVAQDDKSGDFSRETPEHYSEPIVDIKVNRAAWEEKIRKYTAPFAAHAAIFSRMPRCARSAPRPPIRRWPPTRSSTSSCCRRFRPCIGGASGWVIRRRPPHGVVF